MDETSGDVPSPLLEVCYQCKNSCIHHWITCINEEDGQTGQDAYETFLMASQDSLEIFDPSGHTNPLESENDTIQGMVVRPQKCATQTVFPPKGTRKTDLYRRLKRRMGRTLRSRLNRRGLVSHRKTNTYQPTGNKGSSPGPAVLQNNLQEQPRFDCLRQHLCVVIHKQRGRYKIRRTLHSNVENPDLLQHQQCQTQSKTHTGVTQCDSRRLLQEKSNPTHRVVPISTNLQKISKIWESLQVDLFVTSLNTKLPLYISTIPDSHVWR